MGVGTEVLIVDWPSVEAVTADDREDLLIEATFGEAYNDDLGEHDWSWPAQPGTDW